MLIIFLGGGLGEDLEGDFRFDLEQLRLGHLVKHGGVIVVIGIIVIELVRDVNETLREVLGLTLPISLGGLLITLPPVQDS